MSAKFTPGPWKINYGDLHDHGGDGDENGFHITMAEYSPRGGQVIHSIRYAEDIFPEDKGYAEAEANARLIAAAPDLLEACKALQMEAAARGCGLRIADEAIAKAEGRA